MSVKEMYKGREMTGTTTLAESVYEEMGGTTPLITESQTVKGAVNELKTIEGTEAYDNTATYAVGDYCIYNSTRYKCITAVTTAEDFDSTKWSATTTNNDISELNSSLIYNVGTYTIDDMILSAYIGANGNNCSFYFPFEINSNITTISMSVTGASLFCTEKRITASDLDFSNINYFILSKGVRIQVPFINSTTATGNRCATIRLENCSITFS